MSKLKRIKDLFDEKHEVMAWVIVASASALLLTGKVGEWAWVSSMGMALATMGVFKGKAGPAGVEVDGG